MEFENARRFIKEDNKQNEVAKVGGVGRKVKYTYNAFLDYIRFHRSRFIQLSLLLCLTSNIQVYPLDA